MSVFTIYFWQSIGKASDHKYTGDWGDAELIHSCFFYKINSFLNITGGQLVKY